MPFDIDGLSLEALYELNDQVVERIKILQAMQAHVDMMSFNLGARVSFDTDQGRVVGTLIKRNRKTVNVAGDNGRQYRVNPGLLAAVKDINTTTASQSSKKHKKKRLR